MSTERIEDFLRDLPRIVAERQQKLTRDVLKAPPNGTSPYVSWLNQVRLFQSVRGNADVIESMSFKKLQETLTSAFGKDGLEEVLKHIEATKSP